MAAAAYAAVISVRRVLEDFLHPARHWILLDTQHFRSLLQKVFSFQHFLEDYDALPVTSKSEAEDGVEGQLAKACYAVEDIIESFVSDQILASPNLQALDMILTRFSQDFPKVLQDVDFIEKKVVKIKGKMGVVKDQQPVNSLPVAGLSRRLAPVASNTMAGLDSHLFQMKKRLVGDEPKLQMVSIVGMGGIDKTTLARTVYDNPMIVQNFEIRAWVTISQEYNMREILLALLHVTETLFGDRKQEDSANNFANFVFLGVCPPELEKVGKQIAKSCKGLPLALVVIGGLLAKSQRTIVQWKYVAENLTSIINLGNEEQCLKILSLSYSHLPLHLKPCFLYMAIFPEDFEIRISKLIKLWIAEGFVNPTVTRSLEDIAMEYLGELIDRNLLIVSQRGILGNVKSCIIHNLLRDLRLREAPKREFPLYNKVCEYNWSSSQLAPFSKLLRVLNVQDNYSPEKIMLLVNSRYLHFAGNWPVNSRLTSSVSLLWNRETIIVRDCPRIILPSEIWEMTQLRHLEFQDIVLPEPPQQFGHVGLQHSYILENLCSLSTPRNFKFIEEVLKRIPNIKKMKITYRDDVECSESSYCIENLARLTKLESLTLRVYWIKSIPTECFSLPHSLKKLTLSGCRLPWKDTTIVGSLPKLEILKLEYDAFQGLEWNPSDREFARLKFLLIEAPDLEYWGVESTHFPSLEYLVLDDVDLKQLPWVLQKFTRFDLLNCTSLRNPFLNSVEQIKEERESLGYEELQVEVSCRWEW
ncbi:UNVERIFIED_CONTAM: putative late blight resistance proteinR1A-4 [Sesamum latifolium]|uniref:Late blight resistance proteinR1A-4 n=1 Tax=Sesamum latifolium TaxID=2727402 RepID=A0AAW2UDN8_9LAMI